MLTSVSSASPTRQTSSRWCASAGEHAAEAGRARGEADRDGEHVVDDQRGRRQQRRPAPEVRLSRPRRRRRPRGARRSPACRRSTSSASIAVITSVSGSVKRSAAGASSDQHEHHRLGAVGDARQRVEAERRNATEGAQLVPLVGVFTDAPMPRERAAALGGLAGCTGGPALRLGCGRLAGQVAQRREMLLAGRLPATASTW